MTEYETYEEGTVERKQTDEWFIKVNTISEGKRYSWTFVGTKDEVSMIRYRVINGDTISGKNEDGHEIAIRSKIATDCVMWNRAEKSMVDAEDLLRFYQSHGMG